MKIKQGEAIKSKFDGFNIQETKDQLRNQYADDNKCPYYSLRHRSMKQLLLAEKILYWCKTNCGKKIKKGLHSNNIRTRNDDGC